MTLVRGNTANPGSSNARGMTKAAFHEYYMQPSVCLRELRCEGVNDVFARKGRGLAAAALEVDFS